MKNKITLFVLVSLLVISGSIINFQISAYDPVTYDNTITFTASLGSDGKVTTSWSKYNHSEAFTFYKLVRSSTVSNPVYPENSYIYFTTNADILTYTDTKAPAGTNYYRICHIASGKRYCSETVVTINKPSTTCTDSSWTPDTSTVCTGTNFTQTSNCNNTRQSTGTKSCNTCTDSSWTPDTSTVCSTETFTQISNCGNSRQSTGTKSCSTCSDISWSPDPSTVCSNTNFTQTSNCGNVRSVSGTKSCNTCTDSSWTPDTNTVCEGESLTQTSNCGNSRSISGTKVCTITNTGSTVEQNIFYVDPVNGSDSNNGSEASPWKTLDITKIQSEGPVSYPYRNSAPLKIINPNGPVKPGSTIYLKSGNYGTVNIYGYYNSDYITISAAPGSTPIFDQIRLYGGTKWKFNGLTIRGEKTANWQYLVYLLNHNWHGSISDIVFENANIYSVSSISGFTENDWNNKVANALQTNGSNVIIRNNKIKNINFGIITSGNNILVENNIRLVPK